MENLSEKMIVEPRACGHVMSLLDRDDQAWLIMDGKRATQTEVCNALRIPSVMFDRFMRQFARGYGDPIVFDVGTQSAFEKMKVQVQLVCMCGYANANAREMGKNKGTSLFRSANV